MKIPRFVPYIISFAIYLSGFICSSVLQGSVPDAFYRMVLSLAFAFAETISVIFYLRIALTRFGGSRAFLRGFYLFTGLNAVALLVSSFTGNAAVFFIMLAAAYAAGTVIFFVRRVEGNAARLRIPFLVVIITAAAFYIAAFVLAITLLEAEVSQAAGYAVAAVIAALVFTGITALVRRAVTKSWGHIHYTFTIYAAAAGLFNLVGASANVAFMPTNLYQTVMFCIIMFAAFIFTLTHELLVEFTGIAGAGKQRAVRATKERAAGISVTLGPKLTALKASLADAAELIRAAADDFSKNYAKRFFAAIGIAAAAALVIAGVFFILNLVGVHVVRYTPKGEIQSLRTAITAVFSDPIQPRAADIDKHISGPSEYSNVRPVSDVVFIKPGVQYFRISPPVKGSYRIEGGRQLYFTPDEDLKPSMKYTVQVDTRWLSSEKKVVFGKRFSFNTEYFKVTGANIFYTLDMVRDVEKEAVVEVNFNYPVSLEQLRKYAALRIDGDVMDATVEPSAIPTRFYVRSTKVARKDKTASVTFTVKKDLSCIGGGSGLRNDFSVSTILQEKRKLAVNEVKTYPVVGTTYVAVRFNMPVSAQAASAGIRVTDEKKDAVPFTVDAEYCYAVLRADFKPNAKYTVTVMKGLRSRSGETLEEKRETTLSIADMPPAVRFTSPGKVLPLRGNLDIEFYTLNLDRCAVKIDKVFRNNVVHFIRNYESSEYTKSLLYKTVDVTDGKLNDRVPGFINLRKFHAMDYKGLYKIRISDPKRHSNYDDRYILISDLGIIAKQSGDDLIVRVYSIMDLKPLANIAVKLMSYENQEMRVLRTSADGEALIRDYKVNEHNFIPFLVTAENGDDFSFVDLSRQEINQSRFNTGGEGYDERAGGTVSALRGMKAFLTPERGVYRPGEDVFITAVVRNADQSLPPPLPVQLQFDDPTGERFNVTRMKLTANGMLVFKVNVPGYAKTGEYAATLRVGDGIVIGKTSVKIEDFIPDKIKVRITAPEKRPLPGEPVTFTVKANQLFGPPASGRRVVTEVRFDAREFSLSAFKDYSFSDNSRNYGGETFRLGDEKLDENGERSYSVEVPSTALPPSALNAKIYTLVYDEGGRPVGEMKSVPVDRYSLYYGVAAAKKDVHLKGVPIGVSYIAVTPAGTKTNASDVSIVVKRRIYYTIFKRYGITREGYESESFEEVVFNTTVTINGEGSFSFVPKDAGTYTVIVGNDSAMRTSTDVYVQGDGVETLDMGRSHDIVIEFNKEKYAPGETAAVTVKSPIPGRLFFSVEREKVLFSRSVMLTDNKATVEFPVAADYTPNVYVHAFVVRTPDEDKKDLPMTSLGIRSLDIAPGDKRMVIALDAPKAVRSRDGVTVNLKLPAGGPSGGVVLTAVDEGILQITQFETPKPFDFFYAKRRLETRLFTLFDAVLPNVRATVSAIGGGDMDNMFGGEKSRRHVNPVAGKRVRSVALCSGVLIPDAQGNVSYRFTLPDFNGELRVMAIAADRDRYGSRAAAVTVADPIIATASLPRVLAPRDTFEVPVYVYNKTGNPGTFRVSLSAAGPMKVKSAPSQTVELGNESEKRVVFFCDALEDAGLSEFTVTAEGNGEQIRTKTEVPVRPAVMMTTLSKEGKIESGKSVSIDVPGGFIPYGQRVRFSVSHQTLTKYLRSLDYLVRYPYGCAEQVSSAVFGLMYYRELLPLAGLLGERAGQADYYIEEGIRKLEGQQLSDGSFTYWTGGNNGDAALSRYVAHCLIEASRLGHEVSPEVIAKIKKMTASKSIKRGRLDRSEQHSWEEMNTYNLYLRALLGEPDREMMQHLKERKLKDMQYVDRCLLAMAFAASGDSANGNAVLPDSFTLKYFPRALGGDYDSPVKRQAIYLRALAEVSSNDARIKPLVKELESRMVNGHFGSTHENALALTALARAYGSEAAVPVSADLIVNGRVYGSAFSGAALEDNTLSGKTVTLLNKGKVPLYYSLIAEGTQQAKTGGAVEKGIKVEREYFTEDGKKLNLTSVKQGSLIVATLTLKTMRNDIDNVVIVDIFPAGFEMENPRIRSRGRLAYDPPHTFTPVYEDIRDDRMLLFTGRVNGEVKYSYTMRAVSAGEFVVPDISAEAMYDPDVRSISGDSGKVIIVGVR
ncbi:MAG: hypothetical protein HZC28_05335 [Spirochaetes bacterium]|nr:hypothetical protein [Spirochaetota bacterium]